MAIDKTDPRYSAKVRAHDDGLDQAEKALKSTLFAFAQAAGMLWGVYFAAYTPEDAEQLLALRLRAQGLSHQVGELVKDVQQHGMTEADVADGDRRGE